MKNMFKSGKIELIDLLPVISLVVLVIIFGITSGGGLFQSFNIQSVIRDSIPVILGGLGVIFVIATGGCDLSIGAVAAVAATVGAYYGSQYGAEWTIIIAPDWTGVRYIPGIHRFQMSCILIHGFPGPADGTARIPECM